MSLKVTELGASDLVTLREALQAANLPASDVELPSRRFFRFETPSGEVNGFGGLEAHGADLLLRSIVVTGERGHGTGTAIVAELESRASSAGALHLHVLTNSAAAFFAGRGYRLTDRAEAPEVIATSAQFAGLCPASATYLVKPLTV